METLVTMPLYALTALYLICGMLIGAFINHLWNNEQTKSSTTETAPIIKNNVFLVHVKPDEKVSDLLLEAESSKCG